MLVWEEDMVKALRKERDSLREENARLAALVQQYHPAYLGLPHVVRERNEARAEAKRLRLDLTEACRGGAVLARERNEAEALTQRFAKLLERCEDVVLGYDQLHGGGTSPLAQEICAALRGGGK